MKFGWKEGMKGLFRVIAILGLSSVTGACVAASRGEATAACDANIPPITSGYGANGSHHTEIKTIKNPLWRRGKVSVFLPTGSQGRTPVIFFSHAYGANKWEKSYSDLMKHLASRGYVVVFSPYPTFRAEVSDRYNILWKGFELAVQQYGSHMDLTRVGFVGHSFGGGATPAMAYKGVVQNGWGSKGTFMFIMAPWYSYNISSSQLKGYPSHMLQVMQIYDKDTTNDHRMAIDLLNNTNVPSGRRYFLEVKSVSVDGCEVVANHGTPLANNPSLRIKQYAVFRPLDATADYIFNGNQAGLEALTGKASHSNASAVYRPLTLLSSPRPMVPESTFKFSWDSRKNERKSYEKW